MTTKLYRTRPLPTTTREAFQWVPGMTLPDWCAGCEEVFTGHAGPILIIWEGVALSDPTIAREGEVVARGASGVWCYGSLESFLEDFEEAVP